MIFADNNGNNSETNLILESISLHNCIVLGANAESMKGIIFITGINSLNEGHGHNVGYESLILR